MRKQFKLNATAASLLGFLLEKPMSGWDLVTLADDRIGNFWNLTKSQVYRELQSLADEELIATSERGARDKRIFTITSAGQHAFYAWLQQEPAEETIRYPLLLATSFSDHMAPELLLAFVTKHRSVHQLRLEQYEQEYAQLLKDGSRNTGQLLTFSFGISYERMVLAWMDEVERTVSKSSS